MKTFTIGKKKIVLKEEWMVGIYNNMDRWNFWHMPIVSLIFFLYGTVFIILRESVLPIPWDAGS